MSALSQLQFQKNIKDNAEELRTQIKDLYEWERDIKEKEQKNKAEAQGNENEKQNLPPIRSQVEPESEKMLNERKQEKNDSDSKKSKKTDKKEKAIIKANHYKEGGNLKVKLEEYDDAIILYTEAINAYNSDAIYYSNRALCYLKLERFEECLADCDKAIELDPNAIKAHYRRMQANESLGLAHKALADCSRILEIEPKNLLGKKSFNRIHQRIKRYDKNKANENSLDATLSPNQPTFTALSDDSMKEISVIDKPAHLRSKKPLKRILIDEIIEAPKINKNDETSNIQISDEVFDKLFNSSDCGSFVEIKKSPINENDKKIANENIIIEKKTENSNDIATVKLDEVEKNRVEKNLMKIASQKLFTASNKILPEKPTTTAQFHANWKDLSSDHKYLYLKSIETSKLNKILGAGLNSETLSEILQTIEIYYIRDKNPVSGLLLEISKHSEITILALFFTNDDRNALNNIIHYIKENEKDFDQLKNIQNNFNIK